MDNDFTEIRGLLLVNANGDHYFIEGGIKAFKNPQDLGDLGIDPIPEAVLSQIQSKLRSDWFQTHQDVDAYEPNLGPFILQAFNVIKRVPDNSGDSTITGSSTNVEGF